MFKNILVALNGSKFDQNAVDTAANFARQSGGKVTLLKVLELVALLQSDKAEEFNAMKEKINQYMKPLLQQLTDQKIHSEALTKTGSPSLVICKYAEENKCDLIVMPIVALEKTNVYVDSCDVGVLKHSSVPVLFVRKGIKDILSDRRILVVDDEPDILESIEEIMTMCTIDTATGCDEAMEMIENKRYDAAILDIMGVDGFTILKKAVRYGIPSVMLTAHAMSKESLNKAARLGAAAFLPKEEMSNLDTYLADVLKNSGKPIWNNLFNKLSSYFDSKFGWTPEDEKIILDTFKDVT
jgi:nucleotide-binding universal stress UspA family protein/CheY-like chemotaxis protein